MRVIRGWQLDEEDSSSTKSAPVTISKYIRWSTTEEGNGPVTESGFLKVGIEEVCEFYFPSPSHIPLSPSRFPSIRLPYPSGWK